MSDYALVEQAVVQIVALVLEESEDQIRSQPILANYQWDSLAALEALSHLEDSLHITLDLRAYNAARTLQQLVDLVNDAMTTNSTQRHQQS